MFRAAIGVVIAAVTIAAVPPSAYSQHRAAAVVQENCFNTRLTNPSLGNPFDCFDRHPHPYDEDLEARARDMFPWISQSQQRAQWLAEAQERRNSASRKRASSTTRVCEDGHWITDVLDSGEVLKLEDDSLWKVEAPDATTASLWQATDDVMVCDESMILDIDEKETIQVTRIK